MAITATYVTFGLTAHGYTVDVSYRVSGRPHGEPYGQWRQLTLPEALTLIDAALAVLQPGVEPGEIPGQLSI